MLRDVLGRYLASVESAILKCKNTYVERYTEEVITPTRANLRIRLRFTNGSLMEINEALVVQENRLVPLDYRYHFQDKENNLIFRYDNTPHFPHIASFPHHKHLPNKVRASQKPDIEQVLREAEEST